MTVKKAIEKRISIRKYKDKLVNKKLISEIIEAARKSPSSKNTQPWKFKIITSSKVKKLLKDKGVFKQDFVYEAPVIIICCANLNEYKKHRNKKYVKMREKWILMDLSIACYGLVLRAVELGLGACYIGLMNQKKIKKIFKIPKNYVVPFSITLGYPDKDPDQIYTKRKSQKDILI